MKLTKHKHTPTDTTLHVNRNVNKSTSHAEKQITHENNTQLTDISKTCDVSFATTKPCCG